VRCVHGRHRGVLGGLEGGHITVERGDEGVKSGVLGGVERETVRVAE